MDKTVTLELKASEVDDLLSVLQNRILEELNILQENYYQPASEIFVTFLESVQEKTDIYIKLHESIKEPEEEQ